MTSTYLPKISEVHPTAVPLPDIGFILKKRHAEKAAQLPGMYVYGPVAMSPPPRRQHSAATRTALTMMDPLTTRTIHRKRGPGERGSPSSPEPVGEDTEVTPSND